MSISLLEVDHIVVIDFIVLDQTTIDERQDVIALESQDDVDNLLQCAIEFVLKNDKASLQITKTKEDEISRIQYLVENWAKSAKLLCVHYDLAGASLTHKTAFASILRAGSINPLAVKCFPEILSEADLQLDQSELSVVTIRTFTGEKYLKHFEACTVTKYVKQLVEQLEEDTQSLIFGVDVHPYLEFQNSNRTWERYWLVQDSGVL